MDLDTVFMLDRELVDIQFKTKDMMDVNHILLVAD
jgi:hypothetical protein